MKPRATSLFLILVFASSVMAGMPMHSGKMGMECCDKARSKDQTPQANAARLCCAVNCSDPVPTSSGSSFTTAPVNIQVSRSIGEQISALVRVERFRPDRDSFYFQPIPTRIVQPKYIQHRSFLI
jgi:hypothetical protein